MLRRFVFLATAIVCLISAGLVAYEMSRVGVHQGYAPEQPIAFSHKLHAGDSRIQCLYCHFGARTSRHAGIPPVNVCMNCHGMLTKQSVDIEKLKELVERRQPAQWIKVHNLPDFVYFTHEMHMKGGLQCADCHGQVDRIRETPRAATYEMGWCLACHRERRASVDCWTCHK